MSQKKHKQNLHLLPFVEELDKVMRNEYPVKKIKIIIKKT